MEERSKWIDCAKLVAMLGVLVDHTRTLLYDNPLVNIASFYAVPLFIIIAGMLSFRSIDRHRLGWFQTFLKAAKKIVPAYVLATFVFQVCGTRSFDFAVFLDDLCHFSAAGPFYYVLLYLQLMLVCKALFVVASSAPKKMGWLWHTVVFALLLLFAAWSVNKTNILHVYGGGGRLLGASYLVLFYLGMLLEKSGVFRTNSLKVQAVTACLCLILAVLWLRFQSVDLLAWDKSLPYGNAVNPPGPLVSLLAVIVLFLCWGGFSLLERIRPLRWIPAAASWLGQHTLYIFLYHRLLLDGVLKQYYQAKNIWFTIVVFFVVMIFGPILIETVVRGIKRLAAVLSERAMSADGERTASR